MKNSKLLKNIGYNIQSARLKKGYTQEYLAEKCDVSPKYISSIETGKTTGSIPLIINICNVLEVSPNYIFNKIIKSTNNSIDILPNETSLIYLKLNNENKSFVNTTINHLYSMQNKR